MYRTFYIIAACCSLVLATISFFQGYLVAFLLCGMAFLVSLVVLMPGSEKLKKLPESSYKKAMRKQKEIAVKNYMIKKKRRNFKSIKGGKK